MQRHSNPPFSVRRVSAMVLRAIENDELYIITHKELAILLEGRFERIRRAYPK